MPNVVEGENWREIFRQFLVEFPTRTAFYIETLSLDYLSIDFMVVLLSVVMLSMARL